MYEIAYSQERYELLDATCRTELKKLRSFFSAFAITDTSTQIPLFIEKNQLSLYTFSGSRVNKTISLLLDINGIENTFSDQNSCFYLKTAPEELVSSWKAATTIPENIDGHIAKQLAEKPALLDFSKWGQFLPTHLKIRLLKQKYYDLEVAAEVSNWILIKNEEIS
jgi:ATP-dependent Lhr-like helicase